jgi:Bacterial SH3 domain
VTNFDKVIPPGSEGKVNATVDIGHSKGAIQKQIQLETDDPDTSQTNLFIKAVIKTYVDIQPSEQITFRLNKGRPESQDLTITPAAGQGIKLHDAVVNSNFFDVKLEPRGDAYALNVSVKPDVPIGSQQAVIKIQEDGPEKEVTIPIYALVQGAISVAPPAVAFDIRNYPETVAPPLALDIHKEPGTDSAVIENLAAGSSLRVISQNTKWYQVITPSNKVGWIDKLKVKTTKAYARPEPVTVALQKANGADFKVLDYSTTLAQIKVEKLTDDGKNYTFKITLLRYNHAEKGNITGSIIVKTDEPDQASIRIPVYINVS